MSEYDEEWIEATENPLVTYDTLTEVYSVDLGEFAYCDVFGRNRKARAMEIATMQARIDALTAAADKYSDNGHFPDCAVNEWTTAECTCGLAELEPLLEEYK